jgi:hypothetical protein
MLKLLAQKKRTKIRRLQDPSEINGDNLNNIRREASRNFSTRWVLDTKTDWQTDRRS